ncbi:MAG: IS21 family transposase [Magnetococcales bacterium]|nr:IS21 family transposase [Magnetococcales bacterium]
MISQELCQTILAMHRNGLAIRQIAQQLKLSRNTVREVVRGSREEPAPIAVPLQPLVDLLPELYRHCRGNAVRIQEVLHLEHGLEVPYSTLTRLIRQESLRKQPQRVGEYHFAPGEEMQHDTSPHRVMLGGTQVTAHCATLVLAYSRRLFACYFPVFTRFEAKIFLSEALRFMQGACSRCVIDNSSVIVASGSGTEARIAAEMDAFAATLGFAFMAHAVGRPQRKGRVERPFHYIEHNFLAGRSFADWDELNAELLRWCRDGANQKVKRVLGTTPEAAYLMERPHLTALPENFPPVFQIEHRVVDLEGCITLERNRYSAPDRLIGKRVDVYKHDRQVRIFFQGRQVAEYRRLVGQRDGRVILPEHHRELPRRPSATTPSEEERLLTGMDAALDDYLIQIKSRAHGRGVVRMRRLLALKRTYPPEPFMAAIRTAREYGLFDLARLERMILKQVAGDIFALEVDA